MCRMTEWGLRARTAIDGSYDSSHYVARSRRDGRELYLVGPQPLTEPGDIKALRILYKINVRPTEASLRRRDEISRYDRISELF